MRRGPGVARGQEELADAGRVGADRVVAVRPREQRPPGGPGHLDDRGRAAVGAASEHAPLGLDRRAERAARPTVDRGVAAERVEQALAAVGHRDLVGGPSGAPGRVGRGGRHLGRRRRAPELVGCGDEVGHADEASRVPYPLA